MLRNLQIGHTGLQGDRYRACSPSGQEKPRRYFEVLCLLGIQTASSRQVKIPEMRQAHQLTLTTTQDYCIV